MPPTASHDKFAEGLADTRGKFPFAKRPRQGFRIAGITDGDRGDRLPARGNFENLTGFLCVEASHLVNEKSSCIGFKSQLGGGSANIVESIPIGIAVALKRELRDGEGKDGGMLSPTGIEFHQDAQHFRKVFRIVFGRHKEGPRLFVIARRCPARSFKQTEKHLGGNRLVSEGTGAPTITDVVLNWKVGHSRFFHSLYPLGPTH